MRFSKDSGIDAWTKLPGFQEMKNRPSLEVAMVKLQLQMRKRLRDLNLLETIQNDEREWDGSPT